MRIDATRSMLRFSCSGTTLGVIGTLSDEPAELNLHDLSMHVNLRSDRTTAWGSLKGTSKIDIVSAAIRYKGAGIEAWIFGGESTETDVHMDCVDMKAKMEMVNGHVTSASTDRIRITRGLADIVINDEEIEL
ncbi:MAG: hypothetical protein IJM25_07945 [Eubacterium sp.]|nr:hypothetical protein [Eubacterium sp.]